MINNLDPEIYPDEISQEDWAFVAGLERNFAVAVAETGLVCRQRTGEFPDPIMVGRAIGAFLAACSTAWEATGEDFGKRGTTKAEFIEYVLHFANTVIDPETMRPATKN